MTKTFQIGNLYSCVIFGGWVYTLDLPGPVDNNRLQVWQCYPQDKLPWQDDD